MMFAEEFVNVRIYRALFCSKPNKVFNFSLEYSISNVQRNKAGLVVN